MTVSDTNIILAIQALSPFSIQTNAEATAGTNTTANILYATASRKQGCYTVFKAMAIDQLTKDLLQIGKTATEAQQEKAIALLCSSFQEAKDPDIFANSVSFGGYSVSRSNGPGYLAAYRAFLDSLPLVDSHVISDEPVQAKDAEDYPTSWRLTGLDSDIIDPF